MTFYRQREAKNRMRKKTDSEAVSEDAANTLIEIASKTFGDLSFNPRVREGRDTAPARPMRPRPKDMRADFSMKPKAITRAEGNGQSTRTAAEKPY